ncbi:TPA: hypothetical protein NJ213_004798, partial [Vibrio parahaemolyticus]|nr:hypothetical protein [Vibrio parahaemolyticus]
MYRNKIALTTIAVTLAMNAHAEDSLPEISDNMVKSTMVTLDYRTPAVQDRNEVILAFDINWGKVPDEACYYIDDEEVGCQGRDDFTLEHHDDWNDYAVVKGDIEVPVQMVVEQPEVMAKVTVKSTVGTSNAYRQITLTGDAVLPFDYENSVEGMTRQTVAYNDGEE